jgi:hypothetical protein
MILWEIARASAFVAFGCYTLVVVWGVLLAGKGFRPAAPQMAFHRFLSSLGLAALTTHIGSLLLDSYSKVYPTTLLGIGAKPAILAGVAALWLTIALPFSMRLRKARWISFRSWRLLHYGGYLVWALALAHGLSAGTDRHSPWALGTYLASAGLVGSVAYWRWIEGPITAPAKGQQ